MQFLSCFAVIYVMICTNLASHRHFLVDIGAGMPIGRGAPKDPFSLVWKSSVARRKYADPPTHNVAPGISPGLRYRMYNIGE